MIDPNAIDTFDASDPIRALYKRAIFKSMGGKPDNPVKQLRYYVMHQLAERAIAGAYSCNVVEFGCWRGHSTMIIADIMQKLKFRTTRFHVFDSFEGLSPFTAHDKSAARKPEDANRAKYATSIETLRELTGPYGFIDLHKGWIPQVFEGIDVGPVGFANIDVNLYEPTLASLAYVYPRMVEGGVIFFDDYGYKTCPGARSAVDEYMGNESTPAPAMFVALPFGSAFLVR